VEGARGQGLGVRENLTPARIPGKNFSGRAGIRFEIIEEGEGTWQSKS